MSLFVSFYVKRSSAITFDSVKTPHSLCQHRVPLVKTHGVNYKLTLKGYVENLIKGPGHDLTGKDHVA